MRRVAAFGLAVALAGHASAGPDAVQECRDAWAETEKVKGEAGEAFRTGDPAAIARVYEHADVAIRRFRAAFAAAPWNAFDADKDRRLLDDGYISVAGDARARGDLGEARKALTSYVATLRSSGAFEARGVLLPELDLAAGDVDAAIEGFRAGARHPRARVDFMEGGRVFTALLRSGDILAACGNLDGARDRYVAARKFRESIGASDPLAAAWSDPAGEELAARELVGKPLPTLPALRWIGDAPKDAPHAVTLVVAGRVGCRGDAGRLRALDRLNGDGVNVRVIAAGGRLGEPLRGGGGAAGGVAVRVPRGPDDSEGEVVSSGVAPAIDDVVKRVRERLALRMPLAVAETPSVLPPALAKSSVVLVADRAGTIVHASVAGRFTDWICGIARIVSDGRKLGAARRDGVPPDASAQRDMCQRHLAELAKRVARTLETEHMRLWNMDPGQRSLVSGPSLWFGALADEKDGSIRDATLLLCPADATAWVPATTADLYLWDHVDRKAPQPGLCSYVGRDFARCPVSEGDERAVTGACLHHPGGAIVARADGTTEFLTLTDLGVASEAEKIVGMTSKSPILRLLQP